MDKIYNYQDSEAKLQQFWQENKTYSLEKNPGKLYSIDTPPPTVSGSLHIGHIFSYTQTDILARFKRMTGYSVFYPFGFDDNGLPTERFVEKKRKISSYSMPASEFIKICLEETHEAESKFKQLWQRIGLSADWSKCYSTISDEVRKISQESFIILLQKGYIYRKLEPALYCTTCYTSVAQAELDDKEVSTTFNDIVFKSSSNEDLIISTTRPELLASCVALVYNPKDKRYVHLKNAKAIVPIYNYEVPIVQDELVDITKGTGLVMICTFGDKNDIAWFKKFNLPYRQSIDLGGRWSKISGPLEGMKVLDARKKILELLKENNLLLNQKPINHNVNVHERCKNEIEYLQLSQWFIKILEYKDQFIKQSEQIKWYPHFMKSRYDNWVQNISWDWCISRQRKFGIPFPVWHCKDCNEFILPAVKDLPIDPREQKVENCSKCNGNNIVPDTDVMDTWNTSSLTPQICYNLYNKNSKSPFNDYVTEFIPMSMRPQAHDIIRTWAFYTIVKFWMHQKCVPWNEIVISGHVLASGKEKISKSKENESTTPENLLSRYSADAIRFWTASGSLGQDIAFSETQLSIGQKLINKLWNAFRFCNEHVQNTDLSKEPKELGVINEWILHESSLTFQKYCKYFESNEFGLALNTVEHLFWKDFCDNYLELTKDQLFNPDKYDKELLYATKWTLYNIGLKLLQLYAPYLPYITESIYQIVYKKNININSVHLTKFANHQNTFTFQESSALMQQIISLISHVRKLKTEHKLSLKTELHELNIFNVNKNLANTLKTQEQLIKGITQAKTINYIESQLENINLLTENEIYKANVTL